MVLVYDKKDHLKRPVQLSRIPGIDDIKVAP